MGNLIYPYFLCLKYNNGNSYDLFYSNLKVLNKYFKFIYLSFLNYEKRRKNAIYDTEYN